MRKIYSLLLALFAVCGLASANVITITPTDVSGNDGLIVFECDKADGSTAPAYNATGKDVRVYAKGTFSVACVNGNMSQIVFHISTQGKKRLTSITSNVGQVATQALGRAMLPALSSQSARRLSMAPMARAKQVSLTSPASTSPWVLPIPTLLHLQHSLLLQAPTMSLRQLILVLVRTAPSGTPPTAAAPWMRRA